MAERRRAQEPASAEPRLSRPSLLLEAVRGAKGAARVAGHPDWTGLAEAAIQTTETLLAVGARGASAGGLGTRNGPGWAGRLAAKIGVADGARHGAGVIGRVFADTGAIRIFVAAHRAACASCGTAQPGATRAAEIAAAVRYARGAPQHPARGQATLPSRALTRLSSASRTARTCLCASSRSSELRSGAPVRARPFIIRARPHAHQTREHQAFGEHGAAIIERTAHQKNGPPLRHAQICEHHGNPFARQEGRWLRAAEPSTAALSRH